MKFLALLALTFSFGASAHPVIYDDGLMWGQMMTPDMTDVQLNYSFRYNWAYGLNGWRFKNQDGETREYGLVKLNHLLKRWNNPDSQGNIYLHSGVGVSRNNANDSEFAYAAGAEADWESRVWFVSGKWLHFADKYEEQDLYVARIGHSPIIADVNSLQIWFMGQFMYESYMARQVKVTPLLRFFYHNVLWETGASMDGDYFLSFMIHY